MKRVIVIQSHFQEKSLAVLEDNKLVEFHTEGLYRERQVGNIYLGKVVNILPGMQAAFVDLGIGRNGLLHCDDIVVPAIHGPPLKRPKPSIRDLLKEGQELLVEVVKDGTGTKGPRISTRISLPGRYIVLMPDQQQLFISRRITGDGERKRIKEIALQFKKPEDGVIIRTAAREAGPADLEADFRSLETLWESIRARSKTVRGPALLHRDTELLPTLLRDLLSTEVDRILVNGQEIKEEVKSIVAAFAPHLLERIAFVEGDLFELFKIPSQLEEGLRRKVWLNCGGYLVIDTVEALTVIDVNTGRFIGSTNWGETALKVNLDAAREIGRQLRLRNIGGMVVVDFVDMQEESHWTLVLEELEEQTRQDRVKTQVLGLTKLGLVEISRKKTNKSLAGLWLSNCPYCKGKGKVLRSRAVAGQIRQKLFELAYRTSAPGIVVNLNAQVALLLIDDTLRELERKTGKEIVVIGRKTAHREAWELDTVRSLEEVGKLMLPWEVGQIVRWKTLRPVLGTPAQAVFQIEGQRLEVDLPAGLDWLRLQEYSVEIKKVQPKGIAGKLQL